MPLSLGYIRNFKLDSVSVPYIHFPLVEGLKRSLGGPHTHTHTHTCTHTRLCVIVVVGHLYPG